MIDLIIDTDAAFDDWWAILYLLNHPNVNVKAITIVATGEAHGLPGAVNISKLCALAEKPNIPIAYGQEKPLKGDNEFPQFMRDAMDSLLDIELQGNSKANIRNDPLKLMKEVLSKQIATVLAIGPLTNLAQFCQQYPKLKLKISRLVIMGGALEVAGNISALRPEVEEDVAEWNIYCDPEAARQVFESGLPLELLPLDLTNQFPMTQQFVDSLNTHADNPCLSFVAETFQKITQLLNIDTIVQNCCFWDVLAAMAITEGDRIDTLYKKVVVDPNTGQVKVDTHGCRIKQITALNLKDNELTDLYLNVFKTHAKSPST